VGSGKRSLVSPVENSLVAGASGFGSGGFAVGAVGKLLRGLELRNLEENGEICDRKKWQLTFGVQAFSGTGERGQQGVAIFAL